MKISDDTKAKIYLISIIVAILAVLIWLATYVFPDKTVSRKETALVVGAGVEYEVKPLRSGGLIEFNAVKVDPQYYVEFEVDGETYKIIGNDLYDTYKDYIGDSVEVKIKTYYYPFISKFKKKITIPAAFS